MIGEKTREAVNLEPTLRGSRVMLRLCAMTPGANLGIATIANLQRSIRDFDRDGLGEAVVTRGRDDGSIYVDAVHTTDNQYGALALTVEAMDSAILTSDEPPVQLAEAHMGPHNPDLSTSYAWQDMLHHDTDVSEIAKEVFVHHRETDLPEAVLDDVLAQFFPAPETE